MMSLKLSDIAILGICGVNYHCIFFRISKTEAVNLVQEVELNKKMEHYKTEKLFSPVKMGKEILLVCDIGIEKNKFCLCKSPIFKKEWKE